MFFGAVMLTVAVSATPAWAGISGAIWTTDDTCDTVNENVHYDAKEDVYLNGGPRNDHGGQHLTDGEYYVQITEPDGTVLGTSIGTSDETPIVVEDGVMVDCYQLWAILEKASDGSQGYDDTTNPGGVYKAWISSDPDFKRSESKTDNFKVKEEGDEEEPEASLTKLRECDENDSIVIPDDGLDYFITWENGVELEEPTALDPGETVVLDEGEDIVIAAFHEGEIVDDFDFTGQDVEPCDDNPNRRRSSSPDIDFCPNLPGDQEEVPEGLVILNGICDVLPEGEVLSEVVVAPPPAVEPAVVEQLPFTGSATKPLAVAGLLLLALGGTLEVLSRIRRPAHPEI